MTTLRSDLIRLAHENPALRPHLLPLLREGAEKWIQKAVKDPGALHRHFGIPEGENIPTSKIKGELAKLKKKGEKTDAEKKLVRQLNMALTLRGPKVPPPKGKKATFWDNRRETPAGKSYPKSVWDKISEAKRPFGWSTPARGPSGKYPEPWRTTDRDAAFALLKDLGADRDLYTDYEGKSAATCGFGSGIGTTTIRPSIANASKLSETPSGGSVSPSNSTPAPTVPPRSLLWTT